MDLEEYSGNTVGGIDNLKPFPKGFSGNPLGRPLGSKNRSTIAKEFAATVTGGVNVRGDICPNMTAEELMIAALFRRAFDGDINAIKEIQDTLYGKMTEKVLTAETSVDDILGEIDGSSSDLPQNPVEG